MQIKEVKQTKYVCDSCGAVHSEKYDIWTDRFTGKEVCTKCAVQVPLVDKSIYDCGDDIDVLVNTREVDVSKEAITASEYDMEFDKSEYLHKAVEIRELYVKMMTSLDKAYLNGKVREFEISTQVKVDLPK